VDDRDSTDPQPGPSAQLWSHALDRVREAWPHLAFDGDAFQRHVAASWGPPEGDWAGWLEQIEVADLALAFLCSQGDPAALEAFDAAYRAELDAAFAKMRFPDARRDDVRQRLWQKLFVGEGRRPRILEYSGRGQLRHWFRVTVVRALLDDMRRHKPEAAQVHDDYVLGVPSPDGDPEIEHLKRLYAHEFRVAFESAVQHLEPEDRNVLRAYYASEMTIDELAVAFGIHRATAARRVNRAREKLVSATRQALAEKLRLRQTELESVMRLIESRLHISVGRLLA
jgi:RNA polymerase sigma-70 factor (ECF subfamily)